MNRRLRRMWLAAVAVLFTVPLLAAADDAPQRAAPPSPAIADSVDASPHRLMLQLDPEAARRAGLELERAVATRLEPEVQAYGRVLDPVPIVEAVSRWRAARAQLERAEKELRRVEGLAREEQNASARELETARAAAGSARAERDVAEALVTGALGSRAVDDARLRHVVHELALRTAALVRVDVPASSARPEPERGARLASHPAWPRPLVGEYLGEAPVADPRLPGWGLLFLVDADPPPSGTPIRARVRTAGDVRSGVDVPAKSLVRSDGDLFVFVRRSEGLFERVPVDATSRGDGRWFVESGLQPGDEVVASGAQQLLSAQLLASAGAEED